MNSLVPLDTTTGRSPASAPVTGLTKSQALGLGVDFATFDLSGFLFVNPPSNIIPTLVKSDGSKSNITVTPRQWTATSFTCDLSSATDDTTYVCSIQIFP